MNLNSGFPEQFRDLPKDCIERIWDTFVEVGSGVYLTRAEFDVVFGVVDKEVPIFPESVTSSTDRMMDSDVLQDLYKLYELPKKEGWVDGIEILGAIILASSQLSRREKHLLLRDRCMLFSTLNVASVINGAKKALENRHALITDEEQMNCKSRDIDSWADKFVHKKIKIKVQILETGTSVVEENLKLSIPGKVVPFSKEGIATVEAISGTKAIIGSWELKLKHGTCTLKGKTETDRAIVQVTELDGLNDKGDDWLSPTDIENVREISLDRTFGEGALSAEEIILNEESESESSSSEDESDSDEESSNLGENPGRSQPTTHKRSGANQVLDGSVVELNYGMDSEIGAKQIASGEVVYSAGRYAIVEDMLSVKKGENRKLWSLHERRITALEVHPNGRWVFSAEEESGKILVWDATNTKLLFAIDTVLRDARQLAISKCGKTLFVYGGNSDKTYCFYDISRPGKAIQTFSDKLPEDINVVCLDMLTYHEVILAGSDVVRVANDGSVVRMRWGKTAPKSIQDSLVVVYGSRACITASSASGTIYLWTNDICSRHTVIDIPMEENVEEKPEQLKRRKHFLVHSLSLCHGSGSNAIACGLDDGSIQMLSTRNLELMGGGHFKSASSQQQPLSAIPRDPLVFMHCGLSGLLVASSNGSLYWYSFKTQNDPWSLLKIGHGGVLALKWCWCGPSLLCTTGSDKQLRVWKVPQLDEVTKEDSRPAGDPGRLSESATKYLLMSKSNLSGRVTAIAGDRSRLFAAMEGRRIEVFDIHKSKTAGYDPIPCSLPLVNELAASDNLIAACCSKAKTIQVHAFPSGKLVAKLQFDPTEIRTKNKELRFVSTRENTETILCYGNSLFWDIKTWVQLDAVKTQELLVKKTSPDPDSPNMNYIPVVSRSCLLLYRKLVLNDKKNTVSHKTLQAMPKYDCVRNLPIRKPANSKFPVVSVNGKSIRAIAIHPDWSKGVYAIASDLPYVTVKDYKLGLDSPAQAIAFDSTTLMAVCTGKRIYLFDWFAGVKLAVSNLDEGSSTTKSICIANGAEGTTSWSTTTSSVIYRVDGYGDINVWNVVQDQLVIVPGASLQGSNATCITPSGIYGTEDGKIKNLNKSSDIVVAEHGSCITDICQDHLGFVTASENGTIQKWTTMMQNIPLRKEDKVDYGLPVISVWRNPSNQDILAKTKNGVVYQNDKEEPKHDINVGLIIAKQRRFQYAADSSIDGIVKFEATKFRNYAGSIVNLADSEVTVYPAAHRQRIACVKRFRFDHHVKCAALGSSKKVLAVSTVTNDLYILDSNTCTLLYYWPSYTIGCEIKTLMFNSNGRDQSDADDVLMMNDERFVYKT
mmetsp:Transcript_14642/g.25730  ORF Transcript_14642/g.25730 Transcript_14642/m.25730 type:complete len:1332 (-) Transcript_14642:50-4045(-)